MAYKGIIECGWRTGIHDCRGLTYQHPWLVVHRPTGAVVGCFSRKDAREKLAKLKSGVPSYALDQ